MAQNKTIILTILALAIAIGGRAQITYPALRATGTKVEATWESLNGRGYPEWFDDAKLGIFVHWGLYSVPAYAHPEGYAEWLYRGLMGHSSPGRMKMMALYGDTTQETRALYGELRRYWHAELWDPEEWARVFKEAGAKYVVLVTKHHDGYCLWNSALQPEWNSVTSGPHRDIVTELNNAVRMAGMKMCFYYSLPEWSNPLHRWTVDPNDSIGRYVKEYMVPQFKELVDGYRPDMIFADGDWDFTAEQLHSKELIAYYYNRVPNAIVNDRWGNGNKHGFITPGYSSGIRPTERPWAECRGLGRSFGFIRNEKLENIMTSRQLVQHFCELVANGGGLTLNVGPNADGSIPFIQLDRLHELGRWMKVNGEAIYGSRPMRNEKGEYMTMQTRRREVELPIAQTIEFDWARNAPVPEGKTDEFEVTWRGVPEAGEYEVVTEADDSVSVTREGEVMTVRYFERTHEASVRVRKAMGMDTTLLRARDGWRGVYAYDQTVRVFTQNPKTGKRYILEFERPRGEVVVEGYPILEKGTRIRVLGCDGEVKWRQDKKTGRLRIDLLDIDLNDLEYVWVLEVI